MRLLLGEQAPRALRKLEEAHAFIQVGLIRRLMGADLVKTAVLLFAEVARELVVEMHVNPPVQLVHVEGMKALLEAVVFGLEAGDGGLVLLLLVGVAFAESGADPFEHVVAEAEARQHACEPLLDHFLADVGLAAFPLEAGAMVVDVAALLDLSDHGAAAMTAADEAGERELPLAAPGLFGPPPVENALHPLP